jgi:hypothetical protein
MKTRWLRWLLPSALSLSLLPVPAVHAGEEDAPGPDDTQLVTVEVERKEMPVLQLVEKRTRVPWYYLAAVNQYEMGIHWKKSRDERAAQPIQLLIPAEKWNGPANPRFEDSNPVSIKIFGGMGLDGNGDRRADRNDPVDAMFAMAKWMTKGGSDEDAIRQALWDYYQDGLVVDRIIGFSRLFREEKTIQLSGHSFPIPLHYNYSYRSTWGDPRGWGGRRMHEGCDIFADHGTPVLSTAYGMVEVIGWNRYGGWRIGIRDINNIYHYYAHLRGFEKGLKHGSLVKPGQVIGYVGSSGYGRPGTSGKFPPHLHYGMYRETDTREWAFDPTPYLRKWERESRLAKKKKKQ